MNKRNLKITAAAMIGHVLEFFDFTIYAVFAVELGKVFFPSSSEFAQVLSSLAVLAVGFLTRPVGGLLFGHIGDKFGRRNALAISVIGMAIATLIMALLPGYENLGIFAPILLVILRLIQGLCIGGEGAGSSIFVLEHLSHIKPGLIGGIVNSALTVGILLAIVTGLIVHSFWPSNPDNWRIAFGFGGIVGLAGLYLRMNVEETPVFEKLKKENKILELPIKHVLKHNLPNVFLTISLGGITGCSAYMVMTFIDIFYKSVLNFEPIDSLKYAVYANALLIVLLPIMGVISDRIGYRRAMCTGVVLAIILNIPIFLMLESTNTLINLLGLTLLSTVAAIIYAPLYPFMLSLFKPEQRYSGIAFSLNIGIAMFGGTSSMFGLSLIKYTGLNFGGAIYWSLVCFLFLIVFSLVTKTNVVTLLFGNRLTHQIKSPNRMEASKTL